MTDGDTRTATPLLAEMFPGVMIPVPLAKTPNRLEELPVVIEVGVAVKLVMTGRTGFTVTMTGREAVAPAAFVTVRV